MVSTIETMLSKHCSERPSDRVEILQNMQDNTKTITYSQFVITAVLEHGQELKDIKNGVEMCISKELDTDKSNVDVLGLTWNCGDTPSTIDVSLADVNVHKDETTEDIEKGIYVSIVDNWSGVKDMENVKVVEYTEGI